MATFVYAPSVNIHIYTVDKRIIDVSDDLISGSVQRITSMAGPGGVSSVRFTLSNPRRKYDGVFSPMDRIVVYMKRIKKMLVFSGYLDVVPAFTVFPGPVDIQASCTLKRLQYWMWDPDTTEAQGLLNNKNQQYRNLPDAGMAQKTIDLLTTVTGWPKDRIHIGKVPSKWFDAVAKMAAAAEAEAEKAQMLAAVGAGSYIRGNSAVGGSGYHYNSQPAGTDLPATSGKISDFGGPHDQSTMNSNMALTGRPGREAGKYYCAMRWNYVLWNNDGTSRLNPGVDVNAAVQWLKNRPILVVNPDNGKAVVVAAVSAGPAPWTGRNIDLDPTSCAYLGGTDTEVNISWADPNSGLGPVTVNQAEATVGGALQASAGGSNPDEPASGMGLQIVNYAFGFLGTPYVYGGTTTSGFDCSGFSQYVFGHNGVKLPRVSEDQVNQGTPITASEAGAGDLVFFQNGSAGDWDHVGICIGNGLMIAAPHTGDVVKVEPIYAARAVAYRRVVPGAGGYVNPPAGSKIISINKSGGVGSQQYGPTAQTGVVATPSDPLQALFNVFDWTGFQLTGLGDSLGGSRALMNDQPISQTVDSLMSAALRCYCSGPNGDFIAWFPDYFGWWKIAAKMVIRDIELLDFAVGWSDSSLKTHYYVTSSTSGQEQHLDAGSPYQMISTAGIATVEMTDLMRVIFGGDLDNYPFRPPPEVIKAMKTDETQWGQWLLKRFGARPAFEPMQNISGARQEFFFACYRFMQNWASQYAAQIRTTFLPEVYPGMLVVLPTYQFQAYVTDVVHDFSLADGGGFQTTINVVAPSSIGKSGIPGLPRGGPL